MDPSVLVRRSKRALSRTEMYRHHSYAALFREECERYIGSCLTCKVGKHGQRVVVVERAGESGVCWYREMRMKVVSRSPPEDQTFTKTLMAAEPLQGLPLRTGYLRYRVMISVTGHRATLLQMRCNGATWELTDKDARYEVLDEVRR